MLNCQVACVQSPISLYLKYSNGVPDMIQKLFKKPPIVAFIPLVMVGLLWFVPVNSPEPTPAAPTPTVPQTTTLPTTVKNSAVATPTPAPAPKQLQQTAPKQAEIKKSVQTEHTYHIFGTVDDPKYTNGTDWTLAKTNAAAAWDIATGDDKVIVADIDTGFGMDHQDLTTRWYKNPGENGMTKAGDRCWTGAPMNKATNNCDDDNNGYVDDWRGWNFVNGSNNPQAGQTDTSNMGAYSHGTVTAGYIGATGNNGLGSSAINQRVKIMPLMVLDDTGTGYTSDIVAAIYYAVDQGASVINMSLGTYSVDSPLKTAVDYAVANNVVVVAAAGNCGRNADITESCTTGIKGAVAYPAKYPSVIAVGSSTAADERAEHSSFGQEIDVLAPGENLPFATGWSPSNQTSLYLTGANGTSFAAPQVSSLVSLIRSIRPSSSVADITAIVDATARKVPGMNGLFYTQQLGHGVIDAGQALLVAQALNTYSSTPTLLQAGSYVSEHTMPAGTTLSSGCQVVASAPCTVQFSTDNGYDRYLPYTLTTSSGQAGWQWQSSSMESTMWQLRARSGDNVSNTPYILFKKN